MNREQKLHEIKMSLEANIIPLWNEWQDEIEKATEEEKEEAMLSRQICMEMYGADIDSPAAMIFEAFTAGVEKGISVILRMSNEQIEELRRSGEEA